MSRSAAGSDRSLSVIVLIVLVGWACSAAPTGPSRQPIWDVPIAHAGGMLGQPAVVSGLLIAPIGSDERRMQALDVTGGTSRWASPMPSLDCPPYRVRGLGGEAYIGGCGGATAYDAASGQVRWSTRLTDHPNSPTPFAVDSGALYLADRATGRVSAVNTVTGAVRWTWRDTAAGSAVPITLRATVAARGKVYAIGTRQQNRVPFLQGVIVEFDGVTGSELRRHVSADSTSDYRAGVFDGTHRLILSNQGRSGLDAFDLDRWDFAWRVRRPGGFAGPRAEAVVVSGIAYAGWGGGEILAVDIDSGREVWRTAVQGGVYNVVACRNEIVVQHFALTWLDVRTGNVRAQHLFEDSPEYPVSDLIADGERIYAISNSRAYAYRCE